MERSGVMTRIQEIVLDAIEQGIISEMEGLAIIAATTYLSLLSDYVMEDYLLARHGDELIAVLREMTKTKEEDKE